MLPEIKPKRVLFVAPPYFGHFNQMLILARELVALGHVVGFAGAEIFQERILKAGVRFLRWEPEEAMSNPGLVSRRARLWQEASQDSSVLRGEREMLAVVTDSYPAMYQSLEPLWGQFRPELLVVDSAVVMAMDLARRYAVPYVIQLQFLGNHVPIPVRYPRYGTDFLLRMKPMQRLRNWIHPWLTLACLGPEILRLNKVRARFGAHTPLLKLYTQTLVLVCSSFGIELPRQLPPLMRMVGPLLPDKPEPLEASLRAWLVKGSLPTVYVCFGTLATLESWQVQTLVAGFTDARWRVLWSLRPSQQQLLPSLPESFLVLPSVPQQSVLAHPSVKAFVSHCGMNSVSESLHAGKPVLALPFFGDQHYNAARVVDLGAGLRLNKARFSSEEVRSKVAAVLGEASYTTHAQRLAGVLRQNGGIAEAVTILQHTLDRGFGHLVPEQLYHPDQPSRSEPGE